jgi:ADP-ribose pyrophosphatase YjhB (NUDIX family)
MTNRKQPLTYEEFKSIYSKVPRLCVDLIIQNENKEILLIKRNAHNWIGQWHTPGGTVHYREPLHDALARIAKEELGIDIIPGEVIGYLEYPTEEQERGYGYSVSINFQVKIKNGIPVGQNGEEIDYFNPIPENTIHEQKIFLTEYLQNTSSQKHINML